MPLTIQLGCHGFFVTEAEGAEILVQFRGLERRLIHHPDPVAEVALTQLVGPRRIEVDLRVKLGPLGAHLISHQAAETIHRAVRAAISDVERQLERQLAKQRGEPSFGVPSRRRPPSSVSEPSSETVSPRSNSKFDADASDRNPAHKN